MLLAFDAPASTSAQRDGTAANLRNVVVANDVLCYQLQRVRRRTIGFQITDTGLTIRAPRWITLREIEAAIVKNHRWIRTKQVAWQAWRAQQQRAVPFLKDGGAVKYLGQTATLRLIWGGAIEATCFDAVANEVRLALPAAAMTTANEAVATETLVRQSLQVWMQRRARCVFAERMQGFAGRIDARFAGWRLSSARTQWGSCSHDGRIRLNWRLAHFSLPIIDYVIAHELAHLRELNHSPRFWKAVGELLPGFETARDQIKRVDIGAIIF
ncbi:MAG: M48 family metallopeptidase [Burkholderiaceae bacterium]|nr:M48 family metallopeptidase [Burkholderiaceae bacterium]